MLHAHRARRRACSRSTRACSSPRPTRSGARSRTATACTWRSWTPPRRTARRGAPRTAAGSARWTRSSARWPGTHAWITGIRREQSPTRASREGRIGTRHAGSGSSIRSPTGREADVWRYVHEHDLPYHPLHDQGYASIGCAPCTLARQRPRGALGRPGEDRVRTARMSVLDSPPEARGDHMTYEISHLRALESEAIHVIREVAAELERAVLLFSGGKDSRGAAPPRPQGVPPRPACRSRSCTWTPGHNFPEVIEYRDKLVEEMGAQLIVASRAGLDRQRPRDRGDRPARVAQPAPVGDAARRDRGARLQGRLRRRPPRRGAGPRQGAHLLASATTSASGTRRPAPRAVEPLQRLRQAGRARARVPALELDRARRLAVHRARRSSSCRRSTSRTSARSSSATGCSTRSPSSSSCCPARSRSRSRSASARSAT